MGPPTNANVGTSPSPWRRRAGRAVEVTGWLSLAAALAGWAALRAGDLWAPSTVLMFGPRWVFAVPPVLLLPAAIAVRRRALLPLIPALLAAVGLVSGLCIPFERLRAGPAVSQQLRVLTCNMHYAKVDQRPLERLIAETQPEVVAVQEWRDSARTDYFEADGWHMHREPGLFLASRYPIRRAERLGDHSTGERGSVMRYELDAPAGPVVVFNLHLATPREGLGALARADGSGLADVRENSELRWRQSSFVAGEAARVVGPAVLVGDFNTPPESAIFRRVWGGYSDAFADAGWGWGYTFRTRVAAVRIDHVLVGGGGWATRCRVGPDVGSPHRPLLADVAWPVAGAATERTPDTRK